MEGDSALKSLIVGRLGSAITGIVAVLALMGVNISADDVTSAHNVLSTILNSGWGLVSAFSIAVSTLQALWSKYKTR